MTFAKSLFSRALLAAVLAAGAGMAAAGPLYHVDIDTSSFQAKGTGFLDLSFLPGVESGAATAIVSHFTGDFGEVVDMSAPGLSGSLEGELVFDNKLYADLFRSINLGGHVGFDVGFSGPDTGIGGTDFDVSLYDDTGMNYLLASLVHIGLRPGEVTVDVQQGYATVGPVAAVPEPSAALLAAIGLVMVAAVARRRA